MNLLCQLSHRFLALIAIFCLGTGMAGGAEEPIRRSGPPMIWLEDAGQWQKAGDWKLAGGRAVVTAGETLAELTAKQSIRLP